MAIKIASWNVEGRLSGYQKSGRGTTAHILREIDRLDADVLVLPEFYINSLPAEVKKRLGALGYKVLEAIYDDVGREPYERERWGEERIGLLSRLPVSNVREIRPGGLRSLVTCDVTEPETGQKLRVAAIHLEDRTEAMRVMQAEALVKIVNEEAVPTILLGDFNAMWHKGRARLLTSVPVRVIAKCVPHEELRSVAVRVTEMAAGEALRILAERTSLCDADARRRPTTTPKMRFTPYLPSVRLLQLDHMLVTPDVSVNDFTVHGDGGSDHRAISATLDIAVPTAEN